MQARPDHALQILLGTLANTAAVTALVGARIYGAYPIDADKATLDKPLVVVRLAGGDGSSYQPLGHVTMAIRAYSQSSLGAALQVYAACFDALNQVALSSTASDNPTKLLPEGVRFPTAGWDEVRRSHYAESRWSVAVVG